MLGAWPVARVLRVGSGVFPAEPPPMELSRRRFLATPLAVGGAFAGSGLLAALTAETAPLPDLSNWDRVRAQFALERPDLAANGRLAESEAVTGLGEASRFCDGIKNADAVPIHRFPPCYAFSA